MKILFDTENKTERIVAHGEKIIHEGSIGSCLIWLLHMDFEAVKDKTENLLPEFKKIKHLTKIDEMLDNIMPEYNEFCDNEFDRLFIKTILHGALADCIRRVYSEEDELLFDEDIFFETLDVVFITYDFMLKYMTECINQESLYNVSKFMFAQKYYLNHDELLDLKFGNNLDMSKETRSIRGIEKLPPEGFISKLTDIYNQAEEDNALKSDVYEGYNEIYRIADMYELADISMKKILEAGYRFKICEVCSKPFILYFRADTKYCDRMSPKDKKRTCKEYGARHTWYDNINASETKKLYRNTYQAKQMLVKRNPDILSYKEDFENFKMQANVWIKEVKDGVKSEDEYFNWLLDIRRKRFDEKWKRK